MGSLTTHQHLLLMALLLFGSLTPSISRAGDVTVPFVGCPREFGTGATPAPAGRPSVAVSLPPNEAQELAFYGLDGGGGTLAPKGWSCVASMGTAGLTFIVTPQLIGDSPSGISGPGLIQVTFDGGTGSGFTEIQDYLRKMYPSAGHEKTGHDKLVYLNDHLVTFETPPNAQGLGTSELLLPSALPVYGYLQYDASGDSSLTLVQLRLPKKLNWLTKAILEVPAIK